MDRTLLSIEMFIVMTFFSSWAAGTECWWSGSVKL